MPKRKSTKSRKSNQRGFISLPSVLRKKKPARNKSGKFKSKSFKFFGKQIPKLRVYTLAALLVFAGIGAYLTFFSKAATYPQKGMAPSVNMLGSPADHKKDAEMMQQAGVQWARINVIWNEIEKSPGNYWWGDENPQALTGLASQVHELRSRGIGVIMVNNRVPCFASTQPGKVCSVLNGQPSTPNYGNHNQHWKPDNTMHANFMRALAAKFKTKGVNVYEIWNEQNAATFWPSAEDNFGLRVSEYVAMLNATYPAIKAGNNNATVLFGGMTASDDTFLRAAYYQGAGNKLDGVSTHLYPPTSGPNYCPRDRKTKAPTNRNTVCSLELLHKVMYELDPHFRSTQRKIWLTELGWSTCPTANDSRCVHPNNQYNYLKDSYNLLASRYPWVKTAIWYQMRDGATPSAWNTAHGVLTWGWAGKPSWGAYLGTPRGPALNSIENPPYVVPDTIKPTVSINLPKNGATVSGGYVELQSIVSDNNIAAGVYVEYKLNGAKIGDKVYAQNGATGYYTSSTWNSTSVADGTYTLAVVATDAAGNFAESAPISVTVYNSAPPPPSGQCNDGADNDGDGGIDWLGYPGSVIDHQNAGTDPECDSATDSEY